MLRKNKEWKITMSTMKLTLLTDLYELTMMQGYFKNHSNETVVFDAFYRKTLLEMVSQLLQVWIR